MTKCVKLALKKGCRELCLYHAIWADSFRSTCWSRLLALEAVPGAWLGVTALWAIGYHQGRRQG